MPWRSARPAARGGGSKRRRQAAKGRVALEGQQAGPPAATAALRMAPPLTCPCRIICTRSGAGGSPTSRCFCGAGGSGGGRGVPHSRSALGVQAALVCSSSPSHGGINPPARPPPSPVCAHTCAQLGTPIPHITHPPSHTHTTHTATPSASRGAPPAPPRGGGRPLLGAGGAQGPRHVREARPLPVAAGSSSGGGD